MSAKLRTKLFFLLPAVCVVAGACICYISFAAPAKGVLTIAVLNVGQGDAIYIESPTGKNMVIDGGPDNTLLAELGAVMPLGVRTIDVVMETHPDADHIAGFAALLKRYMVGAFIEPGIPKDTDTALLLEREVDDTHVPRYIARRGMHIDLGGGVLLTALYPDHDVSRLRASAANEGAVVLQLTYGSTTALFMADAPKDVEARLVAQDGLQLKSDMLKVGHHGSRTATGEEFATLVHPSVSVISVGAHNVYHLPNKEPIATLGRLGASVLRTDQVGRVVLRSDGTRLWHVNN